jgi:arginine exporter protein ArgO
MSVLFNLEALVAGIALIALGIVGMLANFNRLDLLDTLHRWWPSILVLWGALALARALAQRNTAGGGR